MDYQAVTPSRSLVVTLEYGAGLAGELEAAAAQADLASARFVGSGAVEDATIGYYDQDAFERRTVSFDEPLGMPVVQGTIAQVEERDAETAARSTEDPDDGDEPAEDPDATNVPAEDPDDGDEPAEDRAAANEPAGDPDAGAEPHEPPTEPEAAIWGVFARPSGQAVAGEVVDARVFGGQVFVQGFEEPLGRERHDATGMDLLSP